MAQGGGFAGGSAGDNSVGAVFDLPFHQFPVFLIIDAAVRLHRSDDGYAGAAENRILFS